MANLIRVVALVVAVAWTFAAATSAGAAEISNVFSDSGVAGDTVSLVGSGFGDRRGRVKLSADGRRGRARVKVESWSDGRIRVRIKKAAPGPATFTVTPRGGGSSTAAFTVEEPTLGWRFDSRGGLGPRPAPRGSTAMVIVRGGGNKPKLTVGGRRVKVKRFHKELPFAFLFEVPSLGDGEHEVVAKTRYGTVTSEPGEGLFVGGDDEDLGASYVEFTLTNIEAGEPDTSTERTVRIERKKIKGKLSLPRSYANFVAKRPGGPTLELAVGVSLGTQADLPIVMTHPQYFGDWIVYSEVGGRTRTEWTVDRGDETDMRIEVIAVGGGKYEGTFSATLRRRSGTNAPRLLRIEGSFVADQVGRVR